MASSSSMLRTLTLLLALACASPALAQDDDYDFEAPIEPGHELESSIPTTERRGVVDAMLSWRARLLSELLQALTGL